jgi:cytochrome c553
MSTLFTAVAIALVAVATAATASAEPPVGAVSCTGCHPASTKVTSPVVRLAGRDQAGIVRALQEFRSGARTGTVMDRISKGFTDAEIDAIAAWYASQK